MDWLTDTKIPIGKTAKAAFEWLKDVGEPFFDGLSIVMETLIDAILWVLQTPHPLVTITGFVLLTWILQRSWKTCLFVALGFWAFSYTMSKESRRLEQRLGVGTR